MRPRKSRKAVPRAHRSLARLRPFQVATGWLVAIFVAWMWMHVGPEGWDAFASAALGVSFGGLLTCRLPLPRRAEWSLAWCMVASFLGVLAPDWSGPSELSTVTAVLVAVAVIALVMVTIVAFCTAMREIARAAGSARLVDRWRSVQRWHLGALGVGLQFWLVALPFAERTSPTHFVVDDGFSLPIMLALLVLVGAMIYAAVTLVELIQHLRRTYGLRALAERGQLVPRDDAWSPAAAAPRFVYQCTPPPWESSTTLS